MSEIDLESQALSEDEGLNNDKLVPVSEAIRYRKRAQSAEKDVSSLEQQLAESRDKNKQLTIQLSGIKITQELEAKLTAAGVNDLETAVLMAKARMDTKDGNIDLVVQQLRQEKDYLFESLEPGPVATKTAGLREKKSCGREVLERTAKMAARSGSRADVQEYLKVRRKFI